MDIISIKVFNCKGQIVASLYDIDDTKKVQLQLPADKGLYYIKIESSKGLITKKVINI
jgi:hypothetical protein